MDATASPPPGTAAAGFELVLARSGQRLPVQPGERMADVLLLAGIAVDTVCEQGVCGTCVTRWTAGEPAHHDTCLTADERRTHLAVCCAGSLGPVLTLDL